MKILIIDDEQGILDMYSQYLVANNHAVFTALDGEKGIKAAHDNKPEVIFLDIIMPKYNGLDVLQNIKKDEELKNIPVYLLTNLPEESSGGKATELGAAGYLFKADNEPRNLLDVINKINK